MALDGEAIVNLRNVPFAANNEANGILDTGDFNRDIATNLRRWEQDKASVEEDRKTLLISIDELLLKKKNAIVDTTLAIPDRFRQTYDTYAQIIDLQQKLDVPKEELAQSLFDYARNLIIMKKLYRDTRNVWLFV
ncbi:MAG: hypothetical protein LBH04_10615 [Tannerellaceae bacterium]|jgi:hypothetical protein|nr:hypothetical protein [Tannerellaceae bacterium]